MRLSLSRTKRTPNSQWAGRSNRFNVRSPAFTVMELLVSVSIMAVIVYALYQMFNQTQKALRGNITQVDVLESGRAAMDMMARELEQMTASHYAGTTNLYVSMIPTTAPLVQLDLDGSRPLRTNVLQEFFFLMPQTNKWFGTGYRVIRAENGVGTLFRFSVMTNAYRLSSTNLSAQFMLMPVIDRAGNISTNFHRVADGVIHMRLVAYDADGRRLGYETTNGLSYYKALRQTAREAVVPLTNNVILRQESFGQTKLIFLSNALPAYVDLELGVLEPETFEQYKSLRDGSQAAAVDFLKKRANKVHLFRQRIPIRTARP